MTLEHQQWDAFLRAYGGDEELARAAWRSSMRTPPPSPLKTITTPIRGIPIKNEFETEAELTWAIIKDLRSRGCLCWHNDAGHTRDSNAVKRGRPPEGFPDIPVYAPNGKHVLLEVKQPIGGRLSEEQAKFIKAVNALGHRATVVTSVQEAVQVVFGEES